MFFQSSISRTALMATTLMIVSACSGAPEAGDNNANMMPAENAATPAVTSVRAELLDAEGGKKGEVVVLQQGKDLSVTVSGTGLEPGLHGAHIHMTGACDAPDFKSAGGHWNPANVQHGLDNPQGAHKGDLPNLEIGSDGNGTLSYTVSDATIEGGAGALMDEDGAAFVIHAGEDDMKSDPAGDAGSRVACGVFSAG